MFLLVTYSPTLQAISSFKENVSQSICNQYHTMSACLPQMLTVKIMTFESLMNEWSLGKHIKHLPPLKASCNYCNYLLLLLNKWYNRIFVIKTTNKHTVSTHLLMLLPKVSSTKVMKLRRTHLNMPRSSNTSPRSPYNGLAMESWVRSSLLQNINVH